METVLDHMQHFGVRVQYIENILVGSLQHANHTSSEGGPRFQIRSTVRNSQECYSNSMTLDLIEMSLRTVPGMGERLLCNQAAETMCHEYDLSCFCPTSFSLPYKFANQAFSVVRESTI